MLVPVDRRVNDAVLGGEGKDIRLVDVNIQTIKTIGETLDFYMGKNTPTRRQFIMENLR